MVDALRDVQDPRAINRSQRRVEHAPIRLVGADILGGDDVLEVDAELGGGPLEQRVVDVGHDGEIKLFVQPREGLDRVGKRFPIADARGEGIEGVVGGRERQAFAEAT